MKRQIELFGFSTHFEGTNVYEEFADFYMQGWISANQKLINEVIEKRNKVFSQDEIRQHRKDKIKVPENILTISFKNIFEGGKITPEESQQLDEYNNNLPLLSEEEVRTEMERRKQDEISQIMEFFNLQHFTDDLKNKQIYFLRVCSNPKDLSIGKRGIRSVIKANSGSKTSIEELPESEEYDFDVNSEQIFIAGLPKDYPFIYAYFPDKKYPEGLLRSTLIQEENNIAFIAEATDQLKALYTKYRGKVNFDDLSKKVLDRIIQEHLEQ